MKTTISLSNPLHQRLVLAAKAEKKSFTAFTQELLDKALAIREQDHLDRMYGTLGKLRGIDKADSSDISSSVNDILYGEPGAYQGDDE